MKTITKHLQSFPEPYSTLALRRVVAGKENVQFDRLIDALRSACFPWGIDDENDFWNEVDEYVAGRRKDLPEIPDFLRAELEPEPAPAPECVFKVGEVYKTRDGCERIVIFRDTGEAPLLVARLTTSGLVDSASISRRHLNGKVFADREESYNDLIPPAPPKRVVCLGPEDVPPGTVFRGPGFSELGWSSILASGSRKNGVVIIGTGLKLTLVSYQGMMDGGAEILRPGSTVWEKCEKTVDA